ncbi:hypothetical protein [Cupriavidus pauculus]|uniref:hypothetical protein n=1 Tax=Cupriavidus pauculus TaxID=82633 RepID=UPI001EE37056|nr:hypothetical protein [Cupriavidus pauculus]GJG97475.1 hypothetical protein CBA19C6_23320 [Cupriavidus pauculus]
MVDEQLAMSLRNLLSHLSRAPSGSVFERCARCHDATFGVLGDRLETRMDISFPPRVR